MSCSFFDSQFCILQLTDLHFSGRLLDNYQKRIDDLSTIIGNCIQNGTVLLLVTGDIAFSGKNEEYQSASVFFDHLIGELSRPEYQLKVYFLPGNHDLQNPVKSIQWYKTNQYECDIDRMTPFFDFVKKYNLVFELGQPGSISFDVEGTEISVSGLNSAPLSTLDGDDKGFHRFPGSCRDLLREVPASGIHIFASHHGPEWFADEVRLDEEEMLSNSVDIALFGHEHRGSTRSIGDLTEGASTVVRGGTYSLLDDSFSAFKVLLFRFGELGSYDLMEKEYVWNASRQMHVCCDEKCSCKCFIKSNTHFRPRQEYVDGLIKSEYNSEESLDDVFVFPPLKEEIASGTKDGDLKINGQGVICDIKSFMDYLFKVKTLEIHSEIRAGKSSLLKAIYLESLSMGYSPLLLTQDNSTASITKTLSSIIKEQYGESQEDVERFNRIPSGKVLLLVDDFDLLKRKTRKSEVIASMLRVADNIVLITDTSFQIKLDDTIETDFRHLVICPWTKNKRDQLIRKRCHLSNYSDEKADELIRIVDKAVRSHFQLFEMTPPFINQYIDFYLYESGASFLEGNLPFTSIMSTNVKRRICEAISEDVHLSVNELVDTVIAVLRNLALQIHVSRQSIFTCNLFSQVAQRYVEEYGIPVNARTIIEAASLSGVLLVRDSGYEYCFASRSLHAFFVAQAIDFELDVNEEAGQSYVSRLLNELDYSINEEILVLLESTRFIPSLARELVKRADKAVDGQNVLSFKHGKQHKCLSGLEGLSIKAPSNDSAGALRDATDEMEQKRCEAIDRVSYAGVYEYEVPENRDPLQSAMIAIKYAAIAGRCLDRRQVTLKASDKEYIREQIYLVTGKALDLFLTTLDGSFDEMVEEVANHLDLVEDARPKAEKLLSMVALAGCIGQLDIVVSDICGKLNIHGYSELNIDDDFYSLFMLNAYLRSNDDCAFCKLAKKSINAARGSTSWPSILLISLLSAEYIIEHPYMSRSLRDSLIETVFNGNRKAKAELLKSAQG